MTACIIEDWDPSEERVKLLLRLFGHFRSEIVVKNTFETLLNERKLRVAADFPQP